MKRIHGAPRFEFLRTPNPREPVRRAACALCSCCPSQHGFVLDHRRGQGCRSSHRSSFHSKRQRAMVALKTAVLRPLELLCLSRYPRLRDRFPAAALFPAATTAVLNYHGAQKSLQQVIVGQPRRKACSGTSARRLKCTEYTCHVLVYRNDSIFFGQQLDQPHPSAFFSAYLHTSSRRRHVQGNCLRNVCNQNARTILLFPSP